MTTHYGGKILKVHDLLLFFPGDGLNLVHLLEGNIKKEYDLTNMTRFDFSQLHNYVNINIKQAYGLNKPSFISPLQLRRQI